VSDVVIDKELRAFLDDDPDAYDPDANGGSLVYQRLYVEEPVLGESTSRFVGEGGVRFSSVQAYEVTPESLEPFAVKRRGIADVQLELLKFRFTIDRLPSSRSYESVTVKINLDPLPRVLLFVPDKETTTTEQEITSNSEFTLEAAARLIQLHLAGRNAKTSRQTVQYPVLTALDHAEDGFSWVFEAREGAPLLPRTVITQALIEVPRGTKQLDGTFDSEALVRRRLFGMPDARRSAPVDRCHEFTVDLTLPPLG
jgi:hypothetical protein